MKKNLNENIKFRNENLKKDFLSNLDFTHGIIYDENNDVKIKDESEVESVKVKYLKGKR